MENAGFLLAAFAIIWAFTFCYVFFLVRKQANLKRQLDSLQESLRQGPAGKGNT
jgi:CcmD family protein